MKGDVVHQDDEQEEEEIHKVHLRVYCVEALEEYSKKAVKEANMSRKYQLNQKTTLDLQLWIGGAVGLECKPQ